MTAKEALNNIATISEILVEVSKSHIMSNKAINEIRKLGIGKIYFTLRQALTSYDELVKEHELTIKLFNSANEQLNELERDVKRYFELRSLPDDKYTTEVSRECVRLELKLWKVGKEE